jgi:hypothetical protein
MGLMKLAVVGSIGLVLAGTGYVMGKKSEKDTIAKYALSEPQAAFMTECKTALSAEKKKFKATTANEGCGCLAKQVGTGLGAPEYRYLAEVQRAVAASHGKSDPSGFQRRIEAAVGKTSVPSHRVGDLLARFRRAQEVCLRAA